MSCNHEEATLLWLYGEGEASHAEHVAGCAVCTLIAAEHADVAAAVGPIAHRIEEPIVTPEPANTSFGTSPLSTVVAWLGGAGVVGLVAAALLVTFLPTTSITDTVPIETEVAVLDAESLFTLDELDFEFDDLDEALDDLEEDLFTL